MAWAETAGDAYVGAHWDGGGWVGSWRARRKPSRRKRGENGRSSTDLDHPRRCGQRPVRAASRTSAVMFADQLCAFELRLERDLPPLGATAPTAAGVATAAGVPAACSPASTPLEENLFQTYSCC